MGNKQAHVYEAVDVKVENTEKLIKKSLSELCILISNVEKEFSSNIIDDIKKIIINCPEVAMTKYQDKFELWPVVVLFNKKLPDNKDIVLKILLETNFKSTIVSKKISPFLCSVNHNTEECIKIFLENGLNSNYLNISGNSPLMIIYNNGTAESVYNITKLLIINGADVNLVNKKNFKNVVLTNVNKSIYRNIDFTKTLKLLIDNGADINYLDDNNRNILVYTINDINPNTDVFIVLKIVNLLIKYKVDINNIESGYSILSRACNINHPEKQKLIYLLLENGADINVYSKIKNTPPFFFLIDTNPEPIKDILQLFIERKADFNHKNKDELTFLMKLVKVSRDKDADDSIKMLLESGLVDPNIKGLNGITALQIASENCLFSSSQTTVDLLLEYNAN